MSYAQGLDMWYDKNYLDASPADTGGVGGDWHVNRNEAAFIFWVLCNT